MGSCASSNGNSTSISSATDVPRGSGSTPNDFTCDRHGRTITHFNPLKEELYCLTCYQDYKRRHTRADSTQLQEITDYLDSIQCKQTEIRTLERLRNNHYSIEQRLLQVAQIRNKVEKKRTQILDEIKTFVSTVIELIKHLEKGLYRDADEKLLGAVNELKEYHINLQSELETLENFKNEIENRKSKDTSANLNTVIKCNNFLRKYSNKETKEPVKDYEPTLRLNKNISLNEIIGKSKAAKSTSTHQISLGYVTLESIASLNSHDALSDISEEAPDSSVYTQRSTIHSNAGADRSFTYNSDNIRTGTSTASTTKPKQMQDIAENIPERAKTDKVVNMDHEHLNTLDCDNETYKGEIKTKLNNETFDKSQQRLQFQRDSSIIRSESRRVSYGGTPSRKTPTPRRSSQSIVSPGNITSPFFISPIPIHHRESMDKRIAIKYKDVGLPRDENIANVTDTAQLPDGKIVLCDQKNGKLFLMSKALDIVGEVKLSGHPHNITSVPGNRGRIAVTLPDDNVIKIVDIVDDTFDKQVEVVKLQSKPKCRGIDFVDGNLIYTTRNDVAVLRKQDMTTLWKFRYAFRDPVSLSADRRNGDIYVTCLGLKTFGEVVKMHFHDEKIEYVISCNEIKHPVCSTFDGEGNIYICDVDPPSVHQVYPDGRYCRRLLSGMYGKFQHVSFIEGTDMFIVTENDSDTVHIYEMR